MLRFRAAGLCLAGLCLAMVCFAEVSQTPVKVVENQNRMSGGHLDRGVLTIHLELRRGMWHPEADNGRAIEVATFAEEGGAAQSPGPLIRVEQGTEIHASIDNFLPKSVFVHGLHQHPGKAEDAIEISQGETK